MRIAAILLVAASVCAAAPIRWYGIGVYGHIDTIAGPNPSGAQIDDPLAAGVEFGLEDWDGSDIEVSIAFGTRTATPPATLYGELEVHVPVGPLPSRELGPDVWAATILSDGTVSDFYASTGFTHRIHSDDGPLRFTFFRDSADPSWQISGPVTSLTFQEVPEPGTFWLAAPVALGLLVMRRARLRARCDVPPGA